MLPFFIFIVKKKKYKNNKIHSTALASSTEIWVICTSHVYQRLIPTEADLDRLLSWTCALPDDVIMSNYAHIELIAGVGTAGDTHLAFSQMKVKLVHSESLFLFSTTRFTAKPKEKKCLSF